MSRVIALCFLLLAGVVGFMHIYSRPVWSSFAISKVELVVSEELAPPAHSTNHHLAASKSKAISQPVIPNPVSNWLPDTGAASVHAASLIALKDGAIRAFRSEEHTSELQSH